MLQTGSLAFLAGIILLQTRAVLPAAWLVWLLPLCLLGLCLPVLRGVRVLFWFLAGFLWALFQAHSMMTQRLPANLAHHNLQVRGVIASLPQSRGVRTTADFVIDRVLLTDKTHFPHKLRLSWYHEPPTALVPGQAWQLTVRLHTPHSFMDPGAFDYAAWLLEQGSVATGYVVTSDQNRVLRMQTGRFPFQTLRYRVQHVLQHLLKNAPAAGMVQALLIGERSGIDQAQWRLLRQTGTVHLMAISGLHIGLIAGFVFFLVSHLWRLFPRLCLLLPAPRVAAMLAWLVACGYAALAGFSIPTQRALIMLAVILFSIWFRRTSKPSQVVALALILVLVHDPFAVLSIGFWLSFSAVVLIYYVLQFQYRGTRKLLRWWRMQWAISLGLLPLLVLFFQQAPLLSPLANLVAIPWLSLSVLPLALLSLCLAPLSSTLATAGLYLAGQSLHQLLKLLAWMATLPDNLIHLPAPGPVTLGIAILGLAVLLLPPRFPARYLGLCLFLPLLFPMTTRPHPGAVRLTLLDVGQGLSTVVQTRGHVLVFDTGPRYGPTLDAGHAVIVPYLRRQGIPRIDTLLISHSDMDHVGGAHSLLQTLPVARVMSNVSAYRRDHRDQGCFAGERWRWDDVRFEVLYPTRDDLARARKDNNRSCVLQVTSQNHRFLLTADIEAPVESMLLARYGEKLHSDVLVIPHHGSKTSTTSAFLAAVRPRLALIPSGWHNRFHLPATVVLTRLRERQLRLFDTAQAGAITIETGKTLRISTFRQQQQRYWQAW